MNNQITTYKWALALMNELQRHGLRFAPETFSMKTSSVYIPVWMEGIPYTWDGKTAAWYFFFRFLGPHPDMNVVQAQAYVSKHGIKKFISKIRRGH
jgi:hypothetical protein